MSVPFRNVTVTITELLQAKLDTNQLDNLGTGTVITGVAGFLDYETPMEAYRTFNVELTNPLTLDLNLSDSAFYYVASASQSEWQIQVTGGGPDGGSGTLTGLVARTTGRPMRYDDGLPLDHCRFLLQQATYAISNPAVPA